VLPVRDFILPPGSIAPIHVARPFSLRAVDAAGTESPSVLAVFTQRDPRVETVTAADLHEIGSLVELRSRSVQDGGVLITILEGIRWIALQELEDTGEYLRARITAARRAPVDQDTEAVSSIATAVRTRARTLAGLIFPAPGPVIELIDSIENPEQLADLIIANLPCPVADKARYAAEPDGLKRLVTLRELLDLQISSATNR
jgi:ATP-dependent Lon protease